MTDDICKMFEEIKTLYWNESFRYEHVGRVTKLPSWYSGELDYTYLEERSSFNYEFHLEVCGSCSLEEALRHYREGRVGVSHFVSLPLLDGGAKKGIISRESVFCVRTDLYFRLEDSYIRDKIVKNWYYSKCSYGGNDVLYLSDIVVCRDSNMNLLDVEDMKFIDMFVSLAPNVVEGNIKKCVDINPRLIFEAYERRLNSIIDAAINEEIDVLVIDDMGCDANKCPPEVVADACRAVLINQGRGKAFKKVVFAVDEPYSQSINGSVSIADVFMKRLSRSFMGGLEYSKRQFSIMGDSISTLLGYNPPEYKVFYSPRDVQITHVRSMKDTWWGMVINKLDGYLLVNNSWSGSRVSYNCAYDIPKFSAGCSDERTRALHIDNVYPDVIMVYIGTNDWGFGVPLKDEMHAKYGNGSFSNAYETMLLKLRHNYPDADIWCISLNCSYISANSNFVFPRELHGIDIYRFNKEIKVLCQYYGCRYIDTVSTGLRYDSIDGIHPNKCGMIELANAIIKVVEKFEKK